MRQRLHESQEKLFLAKDFIETVEGLVFAVVESGIEQGKILCFLRYIKNNQQWKKVDTTVANQILSKTYPHYLHYSANKDAYLHAVPTGLVTQHHQPRSKLKELYNKQRPDPIENDLILLCKLLQREGLDLDGVGVTGSILIAAQHIDSDIDLVFYCRETFHLARRICSQLIQQGECVALSKNDWQTSYLRRNCDLTMDEYCWHEQRKFNKVLINKRKVDLSFISHAIEDDVNQYKKLESITIVAQVSDASLAFDYPSLYTIIYPNINTVVCYTATYTGQAKAGEWIKVAGLLEQGSDGDKRIVVGSTREAEDEYIKVVDEQL
ncbi:MAG: hypothetical protein HFP77_03425 [Methylococcales symbiont of Iophon sp. n. MRB-2018]|nr:MAG: hypothetical protein HFP77_03425 [Methylococcales symbiont of Iophon sp. n. MRB-2018]KAF3980266.1 MAG: hypothetical protein HFP76_02890 [Methylococcales symbiont of Iophon sp. n. MRB-2018]